MYAQHRIDLISITTDMTPISLMPVKMNKMTSGEMFIIGISCERVQIDGKHQIDIIIIIMCLHALN